MAISSNMSKQWHENRPPQAELFRVVKIHFVSYGTTRLKKRDCRNIYSPVRDKVSQGPTECQSVTCLIL